MPVSREIDKSRRLITLSFAGEISFRDIQQSRESMLNDPEFDSSFDLLWDATLITSINLSINQAFLLAQLRVMSKTSRVVFVAPWRPVYGVVETFETYSSMVDDPPQTRAFRDRHEAIQWLNQLSPTE